MPGGHVWQHVTLSQGPRMCDIQLNYAFAMEHIPQLAPEKLLIVQLDTLKSFHQLKRRRIV